MQNFRRLLNDVFEKSANNFSGIGLLIYSDLNDLPISSLKHPDDNIQLPIANYCEVVELLSAISTASNKYHDGFHLLNSNLELTHLSQYISAPIVKDVDILNEYGSRYRTALYASVLPNIICSGVSSVNYPLTIFEVGKEIL